MDIVTYDLGALQILKKYLASTELIVLLFTNDIVPTPDDTILSLAEATGGGYARKVLAPSGWVCSIDADGIPQGRHTQQNFTFNGQLAGNPAVYGYCLIDSDNIAIYAQRSPESYSPALDGDAVLIVPTYRLSNGTPT